MSKAFTRPLASVLSDRLAEPRRFIQILLGPRQVGKTTLVRQVLKQSKIPTHYASADEPAVKDRVWLEQQWEVARSTIKEPNSSVVLALDEIQKIPGWSETVKRLWDEDSQNDRHLKVVILGSSRLLVQAGLTESLAGRFELILVPHWSYLECSQAFDWDLDTYLYYGGYPGAAPLIADRQRWARYILDSLIETTISRDILLMTRVDKPALLRRLFSLGCAYSGQILSYQKMLGQLQDAGNTTTLAHYLDLLDAAGMVIGLQKYAGQVVRRRGSSPKLQVYNNALLTAQSTDSLEVWKKDRARWGRLVESAVGAHLINSALGADYDIGYWRQGNHEVDFVVFVGAQALAIEVKSGRKVGMLGGFAAFKKHFPRARSLLVGGDGMPVGDFLELDIGELFQ